MNIDEIPVDTLKPAIGESDQGAVKGGVVNNVHNIVNQRSPLVIHAGQVKKPCDMSGKETPDHGRLCRWCARIRKFMNCVACPFFF